MKLPLWVIWHRSRQIGRPPAPAFHFTWLNRAGRQSCGSLPGWVASRRSRVEGAWCGGKAAWVGEAEAGVAGGAFGEGRGEDRGLHVVVVVDFGNLATATLIETTIGRPSQRGIPACSLFRTARQLAKRGLLRR